MKRNLLKANEVEETLENQRQIIGWQNQLRAACFDAITETDMQEIVKNQVDKAKDGDQRAINFIFSQVLGSSQPITINQTNVVAEPAMAERIAKASSNLPRVCHSRDLHS